MAILSFPAIIPSNISFGIKYSTQINISPLSGAVQSVEIPGARWVANMTFTDMEADETRVLAAFLAELRGSSGRFYLYDFSHKDPRGSNLAAGNVTVDITGQVALDSGTALGTHSTTTLEDSTATFITDGIISANDYIYNATNSELLQILSFTETVITVTTTWPTTPVDTDSYEIYAIPAGNSITTTGWDATETGLLLPGDYIELEGVELKMVTSSVDSDGSGNATINFEPPIRTAPNEASIIKRSSSLAVMLLDNDENRWSVDNAGLLGNITISCVEGF